MRILSFCCFLYNFLGVGTVIQDFYELGTYEFTL